MDFPTINQDLFALLQGCIALLLGGVLGWEREAVGKWAGLRTHMLVCLASMMFVKVGLFLAYQSEMESGASLLRMDPIRVIEAIATGIAFLGAGTIFRDRKSQSMQGLTTAASLLATAPIGIAVAVERYAFAVGTTVLVFIVLRVIGQLEKAGLPMTPPKSIDSTQDEISSNKPSQRPPGKRK